MADRKTDARFRKLEQHQRQTDAALKQVKADSAETRALVAVLADGVQVTRFEQDYQSRLTEQLAIRGWILNDAIRKFYQFQNLPDTSTGLAAYIKTALGILLTVVPALRLFSAFKQLEADATAIAELRKTLGTSLSLARQNARDSRRHQRLELGSREPQHPDLEARGGALLPASVTDETLRQIRGERDQPNSGPDE